MNCGLDRHERAAPLTERHPPRVATILIADAKTEVPPPELEIRRIVIGGGGDRRGRVYHRAERTPLRAIGLMRGEEGHRRIAPVVCLSARTILRIELEYREELDGANPQILEMRDLLDHAREGAADVLIYAGVRVPREAPDPHFVYNRTGRWLPQRRVAVPFVSGRIYDHGDRLADEREDRLMVIEPVSSVVFKHNLQERGRQQSGYRASEAMIQIKDRAAPRGHILSHGFLFPDWPFF